MMCSVSVTICEKASHISMWTILTEAENWEKKNDLT